MSPPLITVAVPLYRSARFVENIADNLLGFDYPNLEFVISDRHGLDDALSRLRGRLGRDPRVRFLEASDRLSWVEHYNLLLLEGRGAYFCWMPHDDLYPPDYLSRLVARLERQPQASAAFGRLLAADLDGSPLPPFPVPALPPPERWTPWTALKLHLLGADWVMFRGVLRRETLLRGGHLLPSTRDTASADVYWAFRLNLHHPAVYDPSCHCTKRIYASSTSAAWRAPKLPHLAEGLSRSLAYWAERRPRPLVLAAGSAILLLWYGARMLVCAVPALRPAARRFNSLVRAWLQSARA